MTPPWVLHLVSHTHWDREWYLSFQRYRFRFIKLMDELLAIFRDEPEYRHFTLDGQTIILKDYLEIRPERRAEIEALVKAGKVDIGPWYTQPNCFLVSGEALIRNLMLGIKESEALGGVMKICYLPDAFGLCAQYPQLLKGFGIEDVVSWRGMPRGTKTAFTWQGADGTDCTLFYMRTNYGNALSLPLSEDSFVDNVDDTPILRKGLIERVGDSINGLAAISPTRNMLMMNGIDHTFPQVELPEIIQRINDKIPDVHARHSSFAEYIAAVKRDQQALGIPLDCIYGELRDHAEGIILPGSQSTRVMVKQFNRRIEGLFEKWMEPFAAYAWLAGIDYPYAEIWRAWEYLLENHAHDSIVCSSVDSTYHQVVARFEWAEELGDEVAQQSLQYLATRIQPDNGNAGKTLVVFNPLAWERSEVVTATVNIPKALNIKHIRVTDGTEDLPIIVTKVEDDVVMRFNPREGLASLIPVQRCTLSLKVKQIPANGYRAFSLMDAPTQRHLPGLVGIAPNILENEALRVEVNPNGTINVLDKQANREFTGLHFFEDGGEAGDGFSRIAPETDQILYSLGNAAPITCIENNALRATLKIELAMDLPTALIAGRRARTAETVRCPITTFVTLTASSRRVDIETHVHNLAKDHRLRVMFPSSIPSDYSYAEQPFDVIQRSIKLPDLNLPYEEPPYATHPQLSFAGITDGQHGLMIANAGLYEYEVTDTPDRCVALTLLRCTDRLHIPFEGSQQNLIPEAQCLGDHVFRYSIIPHQGSWETAWQDAYEFNFPLRLILDQQLEGATVRGYQQPAQPRTLPAAQSFVEVSSKQLQVTAIKKAEREDVLVVRLLNPSPEPLNAAVRASYPGRAFTKVCRMSLEEAVEADLPVSGDGWTPIHLKGKEIATVAFF